MKKQIKAPHIWHLKHLFLDLLKYLIILYERLFLKPLFAILYEYSK